MPLDSMEHHIPSNKPPLLYELVKEVLVISSREPYYNHLPNKTVSFLLANAQTPQHPLQWFKHILIYIITCGIIYSYL